MKDDNVTDIKTLAGLFKKSELQEYCNKQFIAIKKLEERLLALQGENAHLKELLQSTTTLLDESGKQLQAPSEQEICEIQIELIKKKGMVNELSFEDTKRLEVLVKTLKIIKEKAPIKKPSAPAMSYEDLMNLAKPTES